MPKAKAPVVTPQLAVNQPDVRRAMTVRGLLIPLLGEIESFEFSSQEVAVRHEEQLFRFSQWRNGKTLERTGLGHPARSPAAASTWAYALVDALGSRLTGEYWGEDVSGRVARSLEDAELSNFVQTEAAAWKCSLRHSVNEPHWKELASGATLLREPAPITAEQASPLVHELAALSCFHNLAVGSHPLDHRPRAGAQEIADAFNAVVEKWNQRSWSPSGVDSDDHHPYLDLGTLLGRWVNYVSASSNEPFPVDPLVVIAVSWREGYPKHERIPAWVSPGARAVLQAALTLVPECPWPDGEGRSPQPREKLKRVSPAKAKALKAALAGKRKRAK